MSVDDPFATAAAPAAPAADDPFGGPSESVESEIAAEDVGGAEAAAPAADLPIVDKEGAPVEPAAAPPVQAEAPAPTPEPQEAPQEATSAPATPEPTPEAPAEPQEAPQASVAATEPTPETPVQAEEPAAATPEAETEGAPPTAGNGPGPRGGKGEVRHYKVLYQTGPKSWEEFDLTTVTDESISVVKVGDEHFIEARNNEHANKLAFFIVGAPEAGAKVWPVPRGLFKPKFVKPAAPKPERQRLEIS